MQRVAIPVFGDRISNRLDCSENVLLVSIENGQVIKRDTCHLAEIDSFSKLGLLANLGIDVLICNGITEFFENRLSDRHIQIIPWISGEAETILEQYLQGTLLTEKPSR
ncbi:MAG: hypothetical protein H6696_00285 [Deferribacteres bacterium]|nr:hypothetical protein [candidate division KSB1 bacterium]MCB9500342.1 hypothetical protein [Deferribacteres bacterium]